MSQAGLDFVDDLEATTLERATPSARAVLNFRCVDAEGKPTRRTVRPVCLTFWGKIWLVTAWCELRDDFRSFRPDRMEDVKLLDEVFVDEKGKDLEAYLARVNRET